MKQRIPAGLIGVAAVLTGMSFGVIRPGDFSGPDLMMMLTITFAIGFWGLVTALLPLALIAHAVRRVSLGSAAVEWRTAMDLGAARSEIVRRETFDGLRLGAIVSGSGALLGVVLTMALPYFQPGDGSSPLPDVLALVGLLICYAFLVLATGLVFHLAARSATKPGPRPGIATGLEQDAPDGSAHTRVSRRMTALLVTFAFSLGVLTVDRVVGLRPYPVLTTGEVWLSNSLGVIDWVAGISGVLVLARFVAWATQRLSARLGSVLATIGEARASTFGLAATIAADGLARRSSLRMLAAGAIGGVMAFTTIATISDTLDQRAAELQAAYLVDYTVSSVAWWEDVDLPTGALQQEIDPDIVDALLADERVIAIPYGVAVGDPFEWVAVDDEQAAAEGLVLDDMAAIDDAAGTSQAVTTGTTRASTLIVDPADLAVRSEDGLRPLGFQDGTITTAYGMPQWEWQWFDESRDDLFRLQFANTTPFVTRAWAEQTFGEVPVVGVLLWPAEADIPLDGGALLAGRLSDDDAMLLDQVVRDAGGTGLPTWAATSNMESISIFSGFFGVLAWVIAPLALLGAGLSISLAIASVKDRRREMATLAALGASPSALRLAPAIEVGATVVAAMLVGLPSGLLIALVLNHPTLVMRGAPLDLGETLWTAGWQLAHVSLVGPLLVGAATLVLSCAAALAFGASLAKGSPLAELREADKEGVR